MHLHSASEAVASGIHRNKDTQRDGLEPALGTSPVACCQSQRPVYSRENMNGQFFFFAVFLWNENCCGQHKKTQNCVHSVQQRLCYHVSATTAATHRSPTAIAPPQRQQQHRSFPLMSSHHLPTCPQNALANFKLDFGMAHPRWSHFFTNPIAPDGDRI